MYMNIDDHRYKCKPFLAFRATFTLERESGQTGGSPGYRSIPNCYATENGSGKLVAEKRQTNCQQGQSRKTKAGRLQALVSSNSLRRERERELQIVADVAGLPKHLLYRFHRQEKTVRVIREFHKTVLLVEILSPLMVCIRYNRC